MKNSKRKPKQNEDDREEKGRNRKQIKRKREEREWWEEYEKRKEKLNTEELSFTYKMLRYYIPFDGKVESYIQNHENPKIRNERIMFLEFSRNPGK